MLYGMSRLSRWRGAAGAVATAMVSFFGLYFAMHAMTAFEDSRYFVILIPLALLFLFEGGRPVFSTRTGRIGGALAGGLVILAYGVQNVLGFREIREKQPANRLPETTFEWINRHAPTEARFCTLLTAPMLTLYTHRPAVFAKGVADPDRFYLQLLADRVDYVYFEPMRVSLEPFGYLKAVERSWTHFPEAADRLPRRFERVYSHVGEGTVLYKVRRQVSYERAYALYFSARQDFLQASWKSGMNKLERALRLDPEMTSALNAYGATCLLTHEKLDRGKAALEKALRLRPDFALARINLDRLNAQAR
jgi:hypothetical protein